MFHRPKRCVVFGMSSRGVAVHVAPPPAKMTAFDCGMYVHADDYDEAIKLIEDIETVCSNTKTFEQNEKVRCMIQNFKKELEQNGFSQR